VGNDECEDVMWMLDRKVGKAKAERQKAGKGVKRGGCHRVGGGVGYERGSVMDTGKRE
jgi:hypothetical protein